MLQQLVVPCHSLSDSARVSRHPHSTAATVMSKKISNQLVAAAFAVAIVVASVQASTTVNLPNHGANPAVLSRSKLYLKTGTIASVQTWLDIDAWQAVCMCP